MVDAATLDAIDRVLCLCEAAQLSGRVRELALRGAVGAGRLYNLESRRCHCSLIRQPNSWIAVISARSDDWDMETLTPVEFARGSASADILKQVSGLTILLARHVFSGERLEIEFIGHGVGASVAALLALWAEKLGLRCQSRTLAPIACVSSDCQLWFRRSQSWQRSTSLMSGNDPCSESSDDQVALIGANLFWIGWQGLDAQLLSGGIGKGSLGGLPKTAYGHSLAAYRELLGAVREGRKNAD